jgi:siroheme synthase-like protein
MKNMMFPVFISLKGKKVLIIGGGEIAARRIPVLLDFGASVTVVSPEISPKLCPFVSCITWKKDEYKGISEMDEVYTLIIAATNNRMVNKRVGDDAKSMGILVSVADKREESTFWFPAITKGDDLIAGIVSQSGNHGVVKEATAEIMKITQTDAIYE